jgi:hypothetical protein
MQYFVLSHDGQQFGPVDLQTLNQWVQQGRILPHTLIVEAHSGRRVPAAQIAGLNLPTPQQQIPYSPRDYPRIVESQGDKQANIAKALGITGIFLCPVFTLIGIVYAAMAIQNGSEKGKSAMVVCLGSLGIMIVLVVILYASIGSIAGSL